MLTARLKSPAYAGLFLLTVILTGCQQPNTPDAVTKLFWQVLLTNNLASAQRLATPESQTQITAADPAWISADIHIGETFAKELKKELPLIEKELNSFSKELKKQLNQLGRELEKISPPSKKHGPYEDTI